MRAYELTESIIAYHATYGNWEGEFRSGDHDIGFHFGSEESASKRLAIKHAENERDGGGTVLKDPNVRKYQLNLNNPLRMGEQSASLGRTGGSWRPERVWVDIKNSFETNNPLISNLPEEEIDAIIDEEEDEIFNSKGDSLADGYHWMREWLVQWLNDKGYDGIIYDNEFEVGGDSYIVFHPNQIKQVG